MAETLDAEVVHVVTPEDREDVELEPELADLADARNVLVCRKGGAPSWFERVRSFFLRRPIEAVTVVADAAPEEGAEVTATVVETELPGVYEATTLE